MRKKHEGKRREKTKTKKKILNETIKKPKKLVRVNLYLTKLKY